MMPPFNRIPRLTESRFTSRRIRIKKNAEIDVGDVPIQVNYRAIDLHLQDSHGKPLLTNEGAWKHVWLRVRNQQSKIVTYGSFSVSDIETAVNLPNSSARIALPEGTWFIEASPRENKGPWLTSAVPVHVDGSSKDIKVTLKESADSAKDSVQEQLFLTTRVLSSRYDREPGNDTSANLRVKLRLRYTNVGLHSLILYRHDNTVFRQMTSLNLSDAESQRYVSDMSLTVATEGMHVSVDDQVPNASFVVLASGQFYETDAEVTVFVRRGAVSNESDGLLPGQYALQIAVSTWPESDDLAERLRSRWRRIGVLWSKDLISLPMSFTVQSNSASNVSAFPAREPVREKGLANQKAKRLTQLTSSTTRRRRSN